ncbi:hypothetical protein AYL99_10224 [Fonsecaea erecta]|uniref:Uncharacterized protein n=1 Tax=Fonsecaea erecta TaxID=1367422 RepID=A0A178Z6V7_9EURO|nr:hypothetical protein AYL99_10224 [Fonsecaea erecta]OAP55251.1 hypothetical protein AYL99_10224 [Fonsecaea erecta]
MTTPNRSSGPRPDSPSSPSESHQRRHNFAQFFLPGDPGWPSSPSSSSFSLDLRAQTTESINDSGSTSAPQNSHLATADASNNSVPASGSQHSGLSAADPSHNFISASPLQNSNLSTTDPSDDFVSASPPQNSNLSTADPSHEFVSASTPQSSALFKADPSNDFVPTSASQNSDLSTADPSNDSVPASSSQNSDLSATESNNDTVSASASQYSTLPTADSSNDSVLASASHDSNFSTTAALIEPPLGLRRVHATTDLNSLPEYPRVTGSPERDLNSAIVTSQGDSLDPHNQANNAFTVTSSYWTDEPSWGFANIPGVAVNSSPANRERETSPNTQNSSTSSSSEDSLDSSDEEALSSVTTYDNCFLYPYSDEIGFDHPDNSPEAWAAFQQELAQQGIQITTPYDRNSTPPPQPSLLQLTIERIIREEILATPSATDNNAFNGHVIEELDDSNQTASDDPTNLETSQTNNSTEGQSAAPIIPPGLSELDQRLIQIPWNRAPGLQPRPLLDYDFEVTASRLVNEGNVTVDPPRIVNPLFPRPGQVANTVQAPRPSDGVMTRRLRHEGHRAFTTTTSSIPINEDGPRRAVTDSQVMGVPQLRRVERSPSLRSLARSEEAEANDADAWTDASEEGEDEVGAPAQEQRQAPEDHWSSGDEEMDEGRVNLDEVDAPVAEQLRAGLAHLSEARVDIDVLDGDLPVGAFRGNPAAIRARAGLATAEGEILGAVGQLWRSLVEAREVAVDAQEGIRQLQDEVRRLTTEYLAAQIELALAREQARDEQQ